jgi:predicted metal-dependent phosphoesterase TrpH
MKTRIITITALLWGMILHAQNQNNVQFPEMMKTSVRKEIRIPDILGYRTLKCDFHMHTIFSDGIVWPTFRVEEAWEEGLDAIAITDHIEDQPGKPFITGDHNSSFETAVETAKEKRILLIHSGEITRKMPPGHLNAIFLNDVNALINTDPAEALMAAKKQGAFIIWNHPGWKAQQPDTCLWMPMHQELFKKGLINGIEVFNEQEYYPIVLDWCLNKKLAVISNSDIHGIVSQSYNLENGHRPMTLVFAKDRSLESIKQALFDGRTLAFFDNKLAGREEFLKALFEASISIKSTGVTDKKNREYFEIKNNSTIPFDVEMKNGNIINIPAEAAIISILDRNADKHVSIKNLYTGSNSTLNLKLSY